MNMQRNRQRGGTLLGFILGALVGLGSALAVAVYITKVPIPFMNKTQPTVPGSEAAEASKNRDWDPNAALAGKPAAKPLPPEPGAAAPVVPVPQAASPAARPSSTDPLGDLVSAKVEARPAAIAPAAPLAPAVVGGDPFIYFIQIGAFRTPEDAEQQRVKLSLLGLQARVSEREQSGRMVWRVRLGPFDKKDDADQAKDKLASNNMDAALVRVQK